MTEPTSGADSNGSSSVLVRIPADKTFVSLIRASASHMAARLDFTVNEITDLRLAVDEACALLLPLSVGDDLDCRLAIDEHELRVEITVDAVGTWQPDIESFGWTILSALVDELKPVAADSRAQLALTKRAHGPAQL